MFPPNIPLFWPVALISRPFVGSKPTFPFLVLPREKEVGFKLSHEAGVHPQGLLNLLIPVTCSLCCNKMLYVDSLLTTEIYLLCVGSLGNQGTCDLLKICSLIRKQCLLSYLMAQRSSLRPLYDFQKKICVWVLQHVCTHVVKNWRTTWVLPSNM